MNKLIYHSLLLLIGLQLVTAISASAKFQTSLLRDCRVYGELYDGIECRNASLTDAPVCTSDEEIVTSPRKNKLCCCTRLGKEEEKGNGFEAGDCRDVGCENPSKGTSSEISCSEGFSVQLFDGGAASCCCSSTVVLSECQIIGCSNVTGGKNVDGKKGGFTCTEGFSILQFGTSVNFTGPIPREVTTPCCCSTSTPSTDRVTCSIRNCEEAPPAGGSCPSGLTLSEVNILINDNFERAISCCCNTSDSKRVK